jgi:hypothetical protein
MTLKSVSMAALLALSALSASALTLQPYEVAKASKTFATLPEDVLGVPGSFVDTYLVTFGGKFADAPYAEIGFAFTEVRLKDLVNIDFGSIAFTTLGGAPIIPALVPVPGTGPADSVSTEFVYETSPFLMTVSGKVVGTSAGTKGSYSFEMVAAPVPEPQTYALALSGLAMVGWAAVRRGTRTPGA